MMNDIFSLTLVVIIVSSLLVAFIRRKQKDRCLKDFNNHYVELVYTDKKYLKGWLKVTGNGVAMNFNEMQQDHSGNAYIGKFLFKSEYNTLNYIIRFVDDLDTKKQRRRKRRLKRINKQSFSMLVVRGIQNFFKAIRDSLVDVANVLIGKSIRQANLAEALKSQNKYVTQVNQQLAGTIEAAYEPMLESSIGKKVIAAVKVGDKTQHFKGILNEYTSEFVELMNVSIPIDDKESKMADMIFPRSQGIVRYLSE